MNHRYLAQSTHRRSRRGLMHVGALLLCTLFLSMHSASAGHAPAGQGVVSLDIYADGGALHLLTGVTAPAGTNLWYYRSTDGGQQWTPAVQVNSPGAHTARMARGADARIAAQGEELIAVWTAPGTGFGGSGPLATAYSADGGRSWTAGPNPADDGSTAGHAFTALSAGADGFDLVWLDTRTPKIQGLRHAASRDGGRSWSANATVDDATCACCWNTLARAADGRQYALYRDREPRDMTLAVRAPGDGAFRRLATVGAFDWRVDLCPHVGGALAAFAEGERLDALVWTGADDRAGLYHLTSPNRGADWSAPARVGGEFARYADLAAHPDGRVLAVWSEAEEGGSAIYAAAMQGRHLAPPRRLAAAARNGSHPRVVATADGFLVLWTETAPHAPASLASARW